MPQRFFPVPNADAYVGDFSAQNLLDGSDVLVRVVCRVPADFDSLTSLNVVFVPAGTGNMRYSLATDFGGICVGETYNVHTDSIAANDVAVAINELECIDISAGVTGVAAGDVIGVEFVRHGSHVNDTVGASVFLLGVVLDYSTEEPPEPYVPPIVPGGGLYPVKFPPQFELPPVYPRRRVETTGIGIIHIRRPVTTDVLVDALVRVPIIEFVPRPVSAIVYESVSLGEVAYIVHRIDELVLLRGYAFSSLQLFEHYEALKDLLHSKDDGDKR